MIAGTASGRETRRKKREIVIALRATVLKTPLGVQILNAGPVGGKTICLGGQPGDGTGEKQSKTDKAHLMSNMEQIYQYEVLESHECLSFDG
jgi:hypothetical protein